jgi:hypothetical protein
MVNIVIDPVIVMTPPDDANRAEVETWLENLTTWLTEALTSPFTWLHYKQASILLEANGQFPGFAQLKVLATKHHLDVNVSQIARQVNAFFRDDELDLTDHLKHIDFAIELEAGSITVEPEQFITRLPDYLHDDLPLLLADCCACKHMAYPFGQNLYIATLALANGLREIIVSVAILYALPDHTSSADNKFTQTFPLLITPDDLLPFTDALDLWAKGEHGIIYAIKQQYRKDWSTTATSPFSFRLGPHFISSVEKRGLNTNHIALQNIIRAASAVIADQARDIPRYELHHFRESETRDAPQLTRSSDQAKAWRLMLQKYGAGWRLHYWQISTAEGIIIEFANVGKESEREIY